MTRKQSVPILLLTSQQELKLTSLKLQNKIWKHENLGVRVIWITSVLPPVCAVNEAELQCTR